jgi:hypothetical protein
MELYEQLKSLVATLEDDFTKFYDKGNKAAGTRVRKGCQDIKNLCQEIRVDVSSKIRLQEKFKIEKTALITIGLSISYFITSIITFLT